MNLNQLSATLARMDDQQGLNMSVVEVKCVLAALGQYLRKQELFHALRVLYAITSRVGQKSLRVLDTIKFLASTETLSNPELYDSRFIGVGSG